MPSLENGPRAHHYQFAHRALPALTAAHGPRLVELARSGDLAALLARLWDDAGSRLPEGERLASAGIAGEAHGLDGWDVAVVRFPPAERLTEAHLAAIAVPAGGAPGDPRYLVLERSVPALRPSGTVLAEWTSREHVNYGDGPPAETPAFLAAVAGVLGRA
ncbi:MAG: hypothetical protein E6J41_06800 [Chloroflexi bacterium]|nr:MAG: hypothetical protein E6J41_06800 [Chloroflexota bacterium]